MLGYGVDPNLKSGKYLNNKFVILVENSRTTIFVNRKRYFVGLAKYNQCSHTLGKNTYTKFRNI